MSAEIITCRKCGSHKPRGDFHRRVANANGCHPHCKTCVKEYKAAYLSRPESKEIAKKYRSRPDVKSRMAEIKKPASDRRKEQNRIHKLSDKAKRSRAEYLARPEVRARVLAQRKAMYHEKHKFDIGKKLDSRLRVTIRRSLKTGKNNRSWRSMVEFDIDQLTKHLEIQFTEGMTWDRFKDGSIEIDHIVPMSSFEISSSECQEFKACWSLANLRPMWSADNNKKRAKRLFLL